MLLSFCWACATQWHINTSRCQSVSVAMSTRHTPEHLMCLEIYIILIHILFSIHIAVKPTDEMPRVAAVCTWLTKPFCLKSGLACLAINTQQTSNFSMSQYLSVEPTASGVPGGPERLEDRGLPWGTEGLSTAQHEVHGTQLQDLDKRGKWAGLFMFWYNPNALISLPPKTSRLHVTGSDRAYCMWHTLQAWMYVI